MTANGGGSPHDREFDIVLFGATGFTGRLVAEALLARPAGHHGVRWALAGRSREKLERVRAELAVTHPAAASLPIVLGDSLDARSVEAMVKRTRVVCTTVGPYGRYGKPLVAACAADGVHYCDLTGETPFIRAAIDEHHARAAGTGAKIVPCCGFDSIPSDLGVLMLHDALAKQGRKIAAAHYRVVKANGGFSGGTVASMLDIVESSRDPAVRRIMGDPYALSPEGRGRDRGDAMVPRRDEHTGHWTGPFLMAAVNTRVVRRSNALLDFAYGRDFRYDEAIDLGAGPIGLLKAAGLSVGVGAAMATLGVSSLIPGGKSLLARVLPAQGEGPSREQRDRGSFRIEIHATDTQGGRATGIVEGNHDPGYGETSIMLAESALCLAEDDLPARGGILTTASAMGLPLIERLRRAGMVFRVD